MRVMKFNPNAPVFWTLGVAVGWLAGDTTGAVVGLAATLGISLVASTVSK